MHQNVVVPSLMSSYNRASVVGGIIAGGVYSLSGKFKGGKTVFAALACNLFVANQFPTLYIDAETTVDQKWFTVLGMNLGSTNRLVPDSFEHATEEVGKYIKKFMEAKAKYPQLAALIVLDSYNKLCPDEVVKVDKITGRTYPLQANMMTQWLNSLTTKLYKYDIAMMIIRHDRQNWNKKFDWQPDTIASGPNILDHDSSCAIRFEKSEQDKQTVDGKEGVLVGHWHRFVIQRNKHGTEGQEGKFYLSNGIGDIPLGYDEYNTAIEEGIYQEVIVKEDKRLKLEFAPKQEFTRKSLRKKLVEDKEMYEKLKGLLNGYWERKVKIEVGA